MKKFNLFHFFSVIILLAALSIIGWMFFVILYPYHVVDIKPGSFIVQNKDKEVHRGENLVLHVSYCKYYSSDTVITNIIVADRLVYVLPRQVIPSYTGCAQLNYVPATIPSSLPIEITYPFRKTPVKLKIVAKYKINAFRTVEYSWTSDEFKILE